MRKAEGLRDAEAEKRAAGLAALDEVATGMTLGLGSGSTVKHFLDGLAEALRDGKLQDIRGVPTSFWTEGRCRELGIPMVELSDGLSLDVVIDGADEVSPAMDLVKGLGGALLREKIVAQAGSRFVIIVDSRKEVDSLGERAPIPVEVIPFGWPAQLSFFRSLGAEPNPRRADDGGMLVTDNGNYLIDLEFESGIESPPALERELQRRAGVVETGLFLHMAHRVLVGTGEGVRLWERADA